MGWVVDPRDSNYRKRAIEVLLHHEQAMDWVD
jgi:hypothetical protein